MRSAERIVLACCEKRASVVAADVERGGMADFVKVASALHFEGGKRRKSESR